MRIAFRTDASLQIGTGHVTRCLTLADALREYGVESTFICQSHPGNLLDLIRLRGYSAVALNSTDSSSALWLGVDWVSDAGQTSKALANQRVDWLVVDHYGLDYRWEQILAPYYKKLLVIDDLADRKHACDLLLDQTFGRDVMDYHSLVPSDCHILCGSHYALLRPEFVAIREYSLQRRVKPVLRELFVNMGGVDIGNATGQILEALCNCLLHVDTHITVVMGDTAPWQKDVLERSQNMPYKTTVLVGVRDIARLMSNSDLAIGAAGATTWERCCLGLPTIMFVLAENQRKIATELDRVGAALLVNECISESLLVSLIEKFNETPRKLSVMSRIASQIVNGKGADLVAAFLVSTSN